MTEDIASYFFRNLTALCKRTRTPSTLSICGWPRTAGMQPLFLRQILNELQILPAHAHIVSNAECQGCTGDCCVLRPWCITTQPNNSSSDLHNEQVLATIIHALASAIGTRSYSSLPHHLRGESARSKRSWDMRWTATCNRCSWRTRF